jgi:hypothetical protein
MFCLPVLGITQFCEFNCLWFCFGFICVVAEEIDEKDENLVECSNMCLVHLLF